MGTWRTLLVMAAVVGAAASDGHGSSGETKVVCSDGWYRLVEERVPTRDDQQHGPDVGSDEWKSAIEFKLGIRGQPDLPSRDSDAWCQHIDRIARERPASSRREAGPSYPCDRVKAGSVEAMICTDGELSALDRTLARVYAGASRKAAPERPPRLRAEQRGWIKGRNECWKSEDKRGCVRDEYRRRIAEHGDRVSLMYGQRSASGARYQGRNETLWEHQGEALVTWGHGAPPMRCRKAP